MFKVVTTHLPHSTEVFRRAFAGLSFFCFTLKVCWTRSLIRIFQIWTPVDLLCILTSGCRRFAWVFLALMWTILTQYLSFCVSVCEAAVVSCHDNYVLNAALLNELCFDISPCPLFIFPVASKSIPRTDGCAWTSESAHPGGVDDGLVNNSLRV